MGWIVGIRVRSMLLISNYNHTVPRVLRRKKYGRVSYKLLIVSDLFHSICVCAVGVSVVYRIDLIKQLLMMMMI